MNSQRRRINIAAFCKVCHDAGKPKSVYTSHFPRRSPATNSPVICPTLLSQSCNYCHQKGHTIRYCSTLANNKCIEINNRQEINMHIDIEKELRIAQKHYNNMENNPNNIWHHENVFFNQSPSIPQSASSGFGDDNGNDWFWRMIPNSQGGWDAMWTNIVSGNNFLLPTTPNTQIQTSYLPSTPNSTPPPSPISTPSAPLKRRRTDNYTPPSPIPFSLSNGFDALTDQLDILTEDDFEEETLVA